MKLTTIAYRVCRMPEMTAFYCEAFGARFRSVEIGPLKAQFAELGLLTLKFVPLRDAVDFDAFPVHQLGFEVADIAAVLACAMRHGGGVQDPPRSGRGLLTACVRDPDGNTIELYQPLAVQEDS